MLIRFKDLKSLTATTPDGSAHAVTDLFVDNDYKISHVVITLGSWFSRESCALRIEMFGTPDMDESTWPTAVSEADVDAAGSPDSAADNSASSVALRGAEGVVVEPRMLSQRECQLAAVQSAADLHRVGRLQNADVMGTDKIVGTLMDVIVQTDDWTIASLVIHAGPTDNAHQRVIPVGMVAAIDWEATTTTLTCPKSVVDKSPELHEIGDKIEGQWYNKVLGYYGLG
jgi:sporulation protein YlmC with PRC-barrel domain